MTKPRISQVLLWLLAVVTLALFGFFAPWPKARAIGPTLTPGIGSATSEDSTPGIKLV